MVKLPNKISYFVIWGLFWLLILALVIRPGLSSLDPDLPWHLKFGQDTWITHQLPNDQIHLWTLRGETWVDHEWLTNVLMFLIYNHFGYESLVLIFSLIVVSFLALIAHYLKKKHPRANYFIMALLLFGYLAILPHIGPRPQVLSLLFLALELFILDRSRHWYRLKTTLLLAALFWLWACLHASFLIGLMILAIWTSEQLIIGWKKQNPKQFWLGLQAGCLSFVATLLTPYGFKLYDFLETYTNNAYLQHISEWKAFYVFPLNYWQLLFIAITVALNITLFSFSKKKSPLLPWQILSLLIFLGLSLRSVRHFPLFFVATCLIFVPAFLQENSNGAPVFSLPKWSRLALKTLLIIALSSLIFFSYYSLPRVKDPFQNFYTDYPCQTVRELQAHPKYSQLKLFNQYAYGGWLIWVWPEKLLFIDGRLPQYAFANWSLLEEYLEFTKTDKLERKLKEYKIEAILWNNTMPQYHLNWLDRFLGFNEQAINGRKNNLKIFLDSSPDWQKVFTDEASSVYIRKDKL